MNAQDVARDAVLVNQHSLQTELGEVVFRTNGKSTFVLISGSLNVAPKGYKTDIRGSVIKNEDDWNIDEDNPIDVSFHCEKGNWESFHRPIGLETDLYFAVTEALDTWIPEHSAEMKHAAELDRLWQIEKTKRDLAKTRDALELYRQTEMLLVERLAQLELVGD